MPLPDFIKRGTVSLFLAIIGGIIAMTSGWFALQGSVADAKTEIRHHIAQPMHPATHEKVDELDGKLDRIELEQKTQGKDIEYIKKGIEQIQRDLRRR